MAIFSMTLDSPVYKSKGKGQLDDGIRLIKGESTKEVICTDELSQQEKVKSKIAIYLLTAHE